MNLTIVQSLIEVVYPPQCILCEARTAIDFSLCGKCWGQTPFIDGLMCDACGCPLPGGDVSEQEGDLHCDACIAATRPWSHGRAVMEYGDLGRKIVLSLKYGDRTELAKAAAPWLARAGRPFLSSDAVLVPIPLHWTRLFWRKYNQSALLARELAKQTGNQFEPDALVRTQKTNPLKNHSYEARMEEIAGKISPHPQSGACLLGKKVVLVDDVMTSGATFTAATNACFAAGAKEVCVLALARATKDA